MRLAVPFQRQADNISGEGYRECFTSSVAMLLMHRGLTVSDDAYSRVARRYGDTTEPATHKTACRAFGARCVFSRHFSRDQLTEQITAGNPVAVGWLHHGTAGQPRGGGHWSVVIGLQDRGVIMHDPNGEALLVQGGHLAGSSGEGLLYSFKNWEPRWQVEGPGTGWAFYLTASSNGRQAV